MVTLGSLVSLDSTLGVFFLAGIFSTCLWGMGCIQLYYYLENSSIDAEEKDKRWIKPYTSVIWILDTVHQGFFVESMYRYFVTNYGNLLYLVRIDKTIIYMGMGSAVIDAMCRCFFVMRVWKLSKKRILTGSLILAVMAQVGVTLAYAGQVVGFDFVPQLVTTIGTERAMNAAWVITDTFIATVMVYLLRKLESNSDSGPGYDLRLRKETYSVLHRLISYTIGTGLVTGMVGIVAFIGSELLPHSLVYLVPDLILPKLHLNCLLVCLNARVGLRGMLVGDAGCATIDSIVFLPSEAENSEIHSPLDRTIDCQIDIEIHQEPVDRQTENHVCDQGDITETRFFPSETRLP